MMIRAILVTLLVTALTLPASAQGRAIAAPEKLEHAARASLATEAVRLSGQGRSPRDSRLNGFVIGFIAGAIPGVILGSLVYRYCDNEGVTCDVAIPLLGGVGGLVGGGIGFAIDDAIGNSLSGPQRRAPAPGMKMTIRF